MAKSMEDREAKESNVDYDAMLKKYPVLTKGLFKPDLRPLLAKYDANLDAYRELVKRKAGLSKYADQLTAASSKYAKASVDNNSQRDKTNKDNAVEATKYLNQFHDFTDQGEKADMTKLPDILKGVIATSKECSDMNAAFGSKENKIDAQYEADLQKICDSCEKESKDIKTGIDKLAGDEDNLEKQIRAVVLSYQKTAVTIDKPELASDLGSILKAFP